MPDFFISFSVNFFISSIFLLQKRQQWWENYNQARRKGVRLEERQANLRQELETLYRKIIGTLMRSQPIVTGVRDEPSRKVRFKQTFFYSNNLT